MNEERMSILKMLSEGKITPEEAAKLLDAVGDAGTPSLPQNRNPKFMRVKVISADGDNVDIRVPLKLIKTGVSLSKFAPGLEEKLKEKNIDLDKLSGKNGEELIEALQELQCNVNSADGDKVNIFCE